MGNSRSSISSPQSGVPTHLGIILDGNRRWAKQKGLPTLLGHKRGYKVFRTITEAAFDRGIEYVSAFIFSTENWNRAKKEVDYLMDLALLVFTKDLKTIHKKGRRIVCLGIKNQLSAKHIKAIKEAEELTRHNTKGTLAICFNYGGQQEIVDATKALIKKGVKAAEITIESLANYLYHPEVPAVDFMIRSSGEMRLSNFMLWRMAYAELYFVDKHWPAFTEADLDMALAEYANRQRRFGK